MQPSGNTILITGGGSGIGLGLARELLNAGNTVIIAGRRQVVLDEAVAASPGLIARTLDISDGQAIADFAAALIAEFPALNVLINNAGIMVREDKIDLAIAEATVTTNLLGPIRLTSALLPHLLAQPRATIVNVSSGLAFVPMVATPTYSATKAALHSWSLALREQLRGSGVEVVEIAPPGVQTDLMPGQALNVRMMPLDAFIAETMAMLRQQPTPEEVYGERVTYLRSAEDQDRFREVFRTLNQLG